MEWIASRTLTDDSGNEVTVALGTPYAVSPEEWACPYKVSGLSPAEEVREAHGSDAVQALLLALEGIRFVLSESTKPLTWTGGEPGDTGIPRLPTMGWGLALRRHVENVMGVEEEFWISSLTARTSRRAKPSDPT
jgi:hypothetical protein